MKLNILSLLILEYFATCFIVLYFFCSFSSTARYCYEYYYWTLLNVIITIKSIRPIRLYRMFAMYFISFVPVYSFFSFTVGRAYNTKLKLIQGMLLGRNTFSSGYYGLGFNLSDSTWELIIFVLSLNSSHCSFNFISRSRDWPLAFTLAIRPLEQVEMPNKQVTKYSITLVFAEKIRVIKARSLALSSNLSSGSRSEFQNRFSHYSRFF